MSLLFRSTVSVSLDRFISVMSFFSKHFSIIAVDGTFLHHNGVGLPLRRGVKPRPGVFPGPEKKAPWQKMSMRRIYRWYVWQCLVPLFSFVFCTFKIFFNGLEEKTTENYNISDGPWAFWYGLMWHLVCKSMISAIAFFLLSCSMWFKQIKKECLQASNTARQARRRGVLHRLFIFGS